MNDPAQGVTSPPERKTVAWFCVGNADERLTSIALENLLVEMASTGASPLSVYMDAPVFSFPPMRAGSRDRLGRHFEHYTALRIPALPLEDLCQHLLDPRRRSLFDSEGSRLSTVIVSGPSLPEDGVPAAADAVVLFVSKGVSTTGWVYSAARTVSAQSPGTPISVIVLNAGDIEEAAVAFHEVREETVSLLGKDLRLLFGGFLKIDPRYAEFARRSGRSLIEQFPDSPLHGQAKYVLKALGKAVERPQTGSYWDRMAGWAADRRGKTAAP